MGTLPFVSYAIVTAGTSQEEHDYQTNLINLEELYTVTNKLQDSSI